MKVKFKYGIGTYSGTIDEMIYSNYLKGRVCIARKYVKPRLTEANEAIGSSSKNLALLWKSATPEFREDYKIYARLYASYVHKKDTLPPTSFALFVKALYKFASSEDPTLDLAYLESEDMSTLGLAVSTVENCVNGGFLPNVPGVSNLNNSY